MTRSMTGFASEETSLQGGLFSWELRSVNHRYLDLNLRLPEEFRALEPAVRQRLSARLGRGKVDCTLRFEGPDRHDAPLELDSARLGRVAEACAQVTQQVPDCGPVDPLRLLEWPGVVIERGPGVDALQDELLALLERTLAGLEEARVREGEQLAAFILERVETVEGQVAAIRARLPQVQEHWRTRLETRLAQFDVEAERDRLEQEMVLLANRMDVEEELDRLGAHVQSLREILQRTDAVGRRLDFVMQECNREANTIASKSQDCGVTDGALELKVAIEQIREQVQNIE